VGWGGGGGYGGGGERGRGGGRGGGGWGGGGGGGRGVLGGGGWAKVRAPVGVGRGSGWGMGEGGGAHRVALGRDGQLWVWGNGASGQLGVGDMGLRVFPTAVGKIGDWKQVVGSGEHSIGLASDGTLWGWGYNGFYNLGASVGVGSGQEPQFSPVKVSAWTDWAFVSSGASSHTLGIRASGDVYVWGSGSQGQLGDGDETLHNAQIQLALGGKGGVRGGVGGSHTLVVAGDGRLWGSGGGGEGQLGRGTRDSLWEFGQIGVGTGWAKVYAGGDFSLGIGKDGSL